MLNPADDVVNFNDIVNFDRPLEHENKTADKIIDQVLGTKPDADCHRTTQECQDGEGNINRMQGIQDQYDC